MRGSVADSTHGPMRVLREHGRFSLHDLNLGTGLADSDMVDVAEVGQIEEVVRAPSAYSLHKVT